jgi:hypothetical protein
MNSNSNYNTISNMQKSSNSQIFKYEFPLYVFYEFLIKNSYSSSYNSRNNSTSDSDSEDDTESIIETKIFFNKETYKRSKLNNSLENFLHFIKPYYYSSKVKYIDECNNYKKLSTIIRQICNLHKIDYENKVKYILSNYEKEYIINLNQNHITEIKKNLKP